MKIGKHVYLKMILLVVLLLASCSVPPSSPAATQVLPVFTTTAQPTVTVTETPSAIDTATTATPPPVPSLTPLDERTTPIIVNGQLKELKDMQAGIRVPGTFVLISPLGAPYQIHVWNMENGMQRSLLPDGRSARRLHVSPDRRWLVYDDGEGQPGTNVVDDLQNRPHYWQDRFLVVTSASGQEILRIAYQPGWGAISRWISNEQLIIRSGKSDEVFSNFTARWVLNPFTSKLLELPPEPKDIYSDFPSKDWHGMGMISYDPAMTRRIYLGKSFNLVLESLPSQQELAQFDTVNDYPAEWSPDGQRFVMVGRVESDSDPYGYEDVLLIVDRDGKISQTIDFARIYFNYSWSPDGQKIAFWMFPPETVGPLKPAVLDLSTGLVTIYPIESSYEGPPTLIWSPDGHQLLLGVTSNLGASTVLIDLNEKWVVPITEGMFPAGWLVDAQ